MDNEKRIEELNEIIRAADKVSGVITSEGWVEYIEPLLDKMIRDIIGGKVNGRYVGAPITIKEDDCTLDKIKYLLGYKAGLIMFHQEVMQMVDDKERAEEILEHLMNEPKVEEYSISDYDTTQEPA